MDYKNLTDEELAKLTKEGDERALDILIQKFRGMALGISRSYFLIGGDQEDLMQEAMIGLYKACLSFSVSSGASFHTFARMCITRNIQTAVKIANRKKNSFLNNSLNLTSQGGVAFGDEVDEEEINLFIASKDLSPDEALIEEEKIKEIKQDIINKLSAFELKVIKYYLKGLSYIEISQLLNQPPKSIDNALTRIKNKLSYLKK